MSALSRRARGLAMLVVIVGLLAVTVLIYNEQMPWQRSVPVTLKAERAGRQLNLNNDVKYHGVIVGEVSSLASDGQNAIIGLQLDPAKAQRIPADVKARILPKTLFGEKEVVLVGNDAGPRLQAGDVIPEDRSKTALELQQVFADLTPLLKTLKPVELNMTLTALADALRGRGEQLGANFARVDTYLAGLNPNVPTLQQDISGVADLASSLNVAAPDLLAMARNFTDNARTVAAKGDTLAQFLRGTAGFADTARAVLLENERNLIRLAKVSTPTLATLARYSPEFPCLLQGIQRIEPLLEKTFEPAFPGRRPALHIELEVINQPAAYSYPKDRPSYVGYDVGPNCRGLPTYPANTSFDQTGPGPGSGSSAAAGPAALGIGPAGGPAEEQLVRLLAAPMLGVPGSQVPDLADLLAGPLLRGTKVSLS